MSHYRASGPDDASPGDCPADGPVDPGRSVVTAVECNTARFVDVTHGSGGVEPSYLVLTSADDAERTLSWTDVHAMPEIQNAIAYFGPEIDSVRVQTRPERRKILREHLDALKENGVVTGFEFADRQFELDVVLG